MRGSGSTAKFKLRDAVPGIRGYEQLSSPLDWLEGSDLIIRIPTVDAVGMPLSSGGKENRFKLYFFGVGLLGGLLHLVFLFQTKYKPRGCQEKVKAVTEASGDRPKSEGE